MAHSEPLDVAVVGAGPAGLSAALVLGRVGRNVLVADSGEPRNAKVRAMHGFLSRDGTDPAELRQIARSQVARYPSVEVRDIAVESIGRQEHLFEVALADHTTVRTRRVILASGVVDELPDIEGLARYWGRGVFNCPYCDGWEHRDQPLAVLGADSTNVLLARNLVRLNPDVVLCTNGQSIDGENARVLADRGIGLQIERVQSVEGDERGLTRLVFADGPALDRRALFVHAATRQGSDLAAQLGCTFMDDGSVQVDDLGHTSVVGVSAIGDMARRPSMPVPGSLVVIAAAEGAVAAVAIDQEFLVEELA